MKFEVLRSLNAEELMDDWHDSHKREEEAAKSLSNEATYREWGVQLAATDQEFPALIDIGTRLSSDAIARGYGEDFADGVFAGLRLLADILREHEAQQVLKDTLGDIGNDSK